MKTKALAAGSTSSRQRSGIIFGNFDLLLRRGPIVTAHVKVELQAAHDAIEVKW